MHATLSPQPGKRFSFFSSGSWILRPFPQPVHVAHRGDAEEAFVLSIEVGGVLVAHAIGCYFSVDIFTQQQTAILQQPQPLLELRGAQRRDGLEVVLQTRDAHAQLARQLLDAQWLVEVVTESFDRSGDVGGSSPSGSPGDGA